MILFHCINMNHFHPVLSRLESCVQKTDFMEIMLPHLFLKHREIKLGKKPHQEYERHLMHLEKELGKNRIQNIKDN